MNIHSQHHAVRPGFHRLRITLAALLLAGAVNSAGAATLVQVTGFGSNPGNLAMWKYVPDGMLSNAPLVVVLHGCSQSPSGYDDESGWTKFSDLWKFALVVPGADNTGSCFGWNTTADTTRGQGEALSIKQMVDKMVLDHGTNTTRVYVTGASAGGAMTTSMLATYPDVFAGGAAIAAAPYRCASSAADGLSCSIRMKDQTPQVWGDLVRAASSWTGPWPKVQVWHGGGDRAVNPSALTEIMEQWTNVHGVDQVPDVEDTVKGHPHKVYKTTAGVPVVETFFITGMGHGVPVDPGTAADQCGIASQTFLDFDICAAYYSAVEWGLNNNDSTAPTTSITAPANGASVSGQVTIQATASDNVAVTKVEFLVDGKLIETDTTSPYSALWDAGLAANGSHSLLTRAFDAAGNDSSSAKITVTVTGGVEDTTPPTVNLTFPANGSTIHGVVTLSATAGDDFGVSKVEFFVDGGSIGTGTPSGTAGPWTREWNTATVTNGSHTIMVKAYDAKGNVATDNDTTVTVNQPTDVLAETFSNLDANGDYYDNAGWSAGGYVQDADSTTENFSSDSAFGYASSGPGCVAGLQTETLSRTVTLGANPELAYWRKLDLHAAVTASTIAYLRVKVNGTVVDDKTVTFANYAESAWTERSHISLASWANQTVTLAFEAGANTPICVEAYSKAWIDAIRVGGPRESVDTTPPAVNLTAPANGATIVGSVDLTATASDNVGVAKVEFYVDGALVGSDVSSPYSFTWDSTSVVNGSRALMAKAYDTAGNAAVDNDTAVTVNNTGSGVITLLLDNITAEDGYVNAQSDGSSAAIGSQADLGMGRGPFSVYGRAVVSFDTSSIPDGSTVTRAWLTVKYHTAAGDPWATPAGNLLVIDVKNGCFGTCVIQTSDWAAAPTASGVANIIKFTSGTQNSSEFNTAGLAAINKTGRTQLKLRFSGFQTSLANVFFKQGVEVDLRVEYLP